MIQTVERATRSNCDEPGAGPAPSAPSVGLDVEVLAGPQAAVVPVAQPTSASALLAGPRCPVLWLSDAIKEWRTSGVRFSDQTWNDAYEPSFRIFRELVADVRRAETEADSSVAGALDIGIQSLTREHIERFHKRLRLLPPRQGKRCDGVEALVRIEEAQRKKQPGASAARVSAHLRHIAPFVYWCELKGYVTADVVKEFKLAMKAAGAREKSGSVKGRKRKGYVAFSPKELKAIFEQPSFRAAAVRVDWSYWVPLLCLFNGLRVAEASQLHTGDLCLVDGVHCLRTATIDEDDDGNPVNQDAISVDEYRRRLKNDASRRTVPVHPRLIELGLLSFVSHVAGGRKDSVHLFPKLNWHPKSLWGRRPSEFMGQLIRQAGAYEFRRKVPHSLRSNFNQIVEKTGLQDALIQRLMGHSTGAMKDERYNEAEHGVAFPAALVRPFLVRADFDLNLPSWHQVVEWRAGPRAHPVTGRYRQRTATKAEHCAASDLASPETGGGATGTTNPSP